MGKPLALDFFCGGGGACIGMQSAGFEVVGIDIKPRPNYPGEHFILADLSKGSPVMSAKPIFCGQVRRASGFRLHQNLEIMIGKDTLTIFRLSKIFSKGIRSQLLKMLWALLYVLMLC